MRSGKHTYKRTHIHTLRCIEVAQSGLHSTPTDRPTVPWNAVRGDHHFGFARSMWLFRTAQDGRSASRVQQSRRVSTSGVCVAPSPSVSCAWAGNWWCASQKGTAAASRTPIHLSIHPLSSLFFTVSYGAHGLVVCLSVCLLANASCRARI